MALLLLSSCAADDVAESSKGKVSFHVDASLAFTQTRAVNLDDYRNVSDYNVQILSGSDVVYESRIGASEGAVELEEGNYTLRAYYGQDAVASQNTFLEEGFAPFSIVIGKQTNVDVTCEPKSARVAVAFGDKMAEFFSDYYVTYSTRALTAAGQHAVWSKGNADPWYLKVEDNEQVTATIHVVRASDGKSTEVVRQHTLSNNQSWTLTVDAKEPEPNEGQVGLTIRVDESTNDHPINIVVPNEWWM